MKCQGCDRTISDESVFCMYCGTPIDFEEMVLNEDHSEVDNLSDANRLLPGEPETASPKLVQKRPGLLFQDPLTLALACLSAILIVALGSLLFGKTIRQIIVEKMDNQGIAVTDLIIPETRESTEITVPKAQPSIGFSTQQVQLNSGNYLLLSDYLTGDTGEAIAWESSDTSLITVDSSGVVTSDIPGSEAIIEVHFVSDPEVMASIKVVCMSESAQALAMTLSELNSGEDNISTISYDKVYYSPNPHMDTLTWDKSLFYTLEDSMPDSDEDGLINSYLVEKRRMIDSSTGNIIDFEIFRSPMLDIINKITAIEYLSDNTLRITDYYYQDDGRLNFVFTRIDSIYTPTYASPVMAGERYYYSDDVLVKWRQVDEAQLLTDIVIGENEFNNTLGSEPLLYSMVEPEIRTAYDLKESAILNRAYITYDSVVEVPQKRRIVGYVSDTSGQPIAAATYRLFALDYNRVEVFVGLTDDNGMYSVNVPEGENQYAIIIQKNGYADVMRHHLAQTGLLPDEFQPTIVLSENDGEMKDVCILVVDAVAMSTVLWDDGVQSQMQRISAATIHLRSGMENIDGEILTTLKTDGHGIACASLPAGTYTAEIIAPNRTTLYQTVIASDAVIISRAVMCPIPQPGEIRIVLTWDMVPNDLDAHLFTPYNESDAGTAYHIWFGNREDSSANRLDIDTTAGYGPETITIGALQDGVYKYYVTDYSNSEVNQTTSRELSYSGATVSVYTQAGLAERFYVPVQKNGVIWEVFEIRNKSVIPIQRYYSNIDAKPWWNTDKS